MMNRVKTQLAPAADFTMEPGALGGVPRCIAAVAACCGNDAVAPSSPLWPMLFRMLIGSTSAASAAPGGSSVAQQVRAMFARYAPDKISSYQALLTRYAGREAELLAALVNKYGPLPGSGSTSAPTTVAGTVAGRCYLPRPWTVDPPCASHVPTSDDLREALLWGGFPQLQADAFQYTAEKAGFAYGGHALAGLAAAAEQAWLGRHRWSEWFLPHVEHLAKNLSRVSTTALPELAAFLATALLPAVVLGDEAAAVGRLTASAALEAGGRPAPDEAWRLRSAALELLQRLLPGSEQRLGCGRRRRCPLLRAGNASRQHPAGGCACAPD